MRVYRCVRCFTCCLQKQSPAEVAETRNFSMLNAMLAAKALVCVTTLSS
jgi:hypothetical protein